MYVLCNILWPEVTLLLSHIPITVMCMQLLRPHSTRALSQACPIMSCIHLVSTDTKVHYTLLLVYKPIHHTPYSYSLEGLGSRLILCLDPSIQAYSYCLGITPTHTLACHVLHDTRYAYQLSLVGGARINEYRSTTKKPQLPKISSR